MRALGLCGSARRNGNTAHLTRAVLEGAKENGFEISEVFLNEAGITPCVGCLKCQTGESTGCSVQDGFHEVIDRIREADLVIIGSPVPGHGPDEDVPGQAILAAPPRAPQER